MLEVLNINTKFKAKNFFADNNDIDIIIIIIININIIILKDDDIDINDNNSATHKTIILFTLSTLTPNISIYFLCTILFSIPMVVMRRIMKEICRRQLLLRKSFREERSFAPQ